MELEANQLEIGWTGAPEPGLLSGQPQQTMAALLARSCGSHPGSTAVVGPEGSISFGDLQHRVHRVGNAFTLLGVERGDRVVIWLNNCPEFLEIEQAAFLFGFARTALAARLHVEEVIDIIRDCSAKLVVAEAEHAAMLSARLGPEGPIVIAVEEPSPTGARSYPELVRAAPADPPISMPGREDIAALLYTSGTTGRPKGAVLRHRNWVAMVSGLMAELPPIGSTDTVLHAGPMSHLSGSIGTACYVRGASTAMLPRFEPRAVLETVERLGVTVLPLVPTMLAALTAEAEGGSFDLSTLRALPYGGSAVSPALLTRAQAIFGDVLVQLYGLSEALVPLTVLSPVEHRSRTETGAGPLASAGRPTPFVDIRIVNEAGAIVSHGDAGEVQVRSETVMAGYWGQPQATLEMIAEQDWVRTGDVGYRDDEGYLYIIDRKSDLVVSGGFNVYPAEVERVIEALPEVDEVVVVGAPHDRWGETVTAVIVLKPDRVLTEAEVIDACRAHLAGYKKPTAVHFVSTLPKNSSGKLMRREVKDRFWTDRDRPIGV